MQYITVADVDAALGSDWADDDKKSRSVAMANAWLTSKLYSLPDNSVPDDVIKSAGIEVAAAAAEGDLYSQETNGSLTHTRAKAGSVETEKTYASLDKSGTSYLPERLQYALALLSPYLGNGLAFRVCRG